MPSIMALAYRSMKKLIIKYTTFCFFENVKNVGTSEICIMLEKKVKSRVFLQTKTCFSCPQLWLSVLLDF